MLHVNAAFPFLYPMRHVLSGQVMGGMFHFVRDFFRYKKLTQSMDYGFPLRFSRSYPCYIDRYEMAGSIPRHYFWQDLWGAKKVYQLGCSKHYDIGSRLDGFIAHCLPFCEVTMLDIRPLNVPISGLSFIQANCMNMPQIPDGSIASLSCFHAVEHFGLGRYGDPVDPEGHTKAISEMKRIISANGDILFSVPVGIQRLEFNGHRIFDPMTIIGLFDGFDLVEFSVIDDEDYFHQSVAPESFRNINYGCGLFHFCKRQGN